MKEKPRVLIVDDNNELLSGMKLFLSPHVGEIVTLRNPNLIPSTLQQSSFRPHHAGYEFYGRRE